MLFRLLAAAALGLASPFASAANHEHGHSTDAVQVVQGLAVTGAWSRAMPPMAPTGAVYFVLQNRDGEADRLLGARTPRADKAELHRHVHTGGMMRMEHMPVIDVPSVGQLEFKPGGYHVMMVGLKKPLVAGERFPLTLEFEKRGDMNVEVEIMEEAPPSGHGHH